MVVQQIDQRFDATSYLAWEEAPTERHECLDGELVASNTIEQTSPVPSIHVDALVDGADEAETTQTTEGFR